MTETLSPALPADVEELVQTTLQRLHDRKLKIATAESCTGGLIASVLTDVDGVAHVFERGFVVYTEEAKTQMLGVAPSLLAARGAVSREVAAAMAAGALERSGADIAVSITGFAGAGAPGDEPGLVHYGCARRGKPVTTRECHHGDIGRGAVRICAIRTAVEMIAEAI